MEIELKPLDQAFEKALELAFREVPFEDRLKATERALEAFRPPKDLVLEAALPGAFHGSIRGVPGAPPSLHFIRYGSVVLKAGEDDDGPALPKGVWAREGLAAPLASPSLYWTRYPLPFPRPLLEGVGRALASLAKEAGVSPGGAGRNPRARSRRDPHGPLGRGRGPQRRGSPQGSPRPKALPPPEARPPLIGGDPRAWS